MRVLYEEEGPARDLKNSLPEECSRMHQEYIPHYECCKGVFYNDAVEACYTRVVCEILQKCCRGGSFIPTFTQPVLLASAKLLPSDCWMCFSLQNP